MEKVDILVVGAGLYGLTMAERFAAAGKNVLIVDRRDHIGGNSAARIAGESGIEYHLYGTHIFHTNSECVMGYVSRFMNLDNYRHRVFTKHNDAVFPMPINLQTINQFYNAKFSPAEAEEKLASEEQVVAPKIGKPLFDALIKNYTAKQWQVAPEELPKSVFERLPVRFNYNADYFDAKYQGLPEDGFESWFEEMTKNPNITVWTLADFKDPEVQEVAAEAELVIYTGPIDEFYDYKFGELSWRGLAFETELLDEEDAQGCAVMNYADADVPWTRIHEYKNLRPRWKYADHCGTALVKEYPMEWVKGDEPYYPVRKAEDLERLEKYMELAEQEEKVIFGGRLGTYQYLDMDQTILAALMKFDEIMEELGETGEELDGAAGEFDGGLEEW